jgi:hypothetical protein
MSGVVLKGYAQNLIKDKEIERINFCCGYIFLSREGAFSLSAASFNGGDADRGSVQGCDLAQLFETITGLVAEARR